MAEYRLSPAAERDLEGIWRHTFLEWGVDHAERYIDILTEVFQSLADSPASGAACDHIRKEYRRRSVGRHMIYFRVEAFGTAIIRVLHDRMDPKRHL